MNNSLFGGTDYAIMGDKVLATMSGNRTVQNTVDTFSLNYNAYSLMQARNELAYLERQLRYSNAYGYRNYEIERQANYYRGQVVKHSVMGVFDLISLLCRILSKN